MFDISYRLWYSNYTFELWMLLHVADMTAGVANRAAYLRPINQYFKRKYSNLDEFKNALEFQRIPDGFITLDTVFDAVKRAERIVENNAQLPVPYGTVAAPGIIAGSRGKSFPYFFPLAVVTAEDRLTLSVKGICMISAG